MNYLYHKNVNMNFKPVIIGFFLCAMCNLSAQKLIKMDDYVVNNGEILMNLSNYPNGIYMVKLYVDEPIIVKLIKE